MDSNQNNFPKMFVFDLDGTILDAKKDIIPQNLKAVQKLKRCYPETKICLATGRPFRSTVHFAKETNADYIITHNGKALYHKLDDGTYQLYKVFALPGSKNFSFSDRLKQPFKQILCQIKNPMLVLDSKLLAYTYQIVKTPSIHKLIQKIKVLPGFYHIKDKTDYSLPLTIIEKAFTPFHVNKKEALLYLLNEKGIKSSEIVVAGNACNDLEMLQLKGCQGYCPANAIQQIKDLPNVTVLGKTNNEAWVQVMLKDFKNDRNCFRVIKKGQEAMPETALEKLLTKSKQMNVISSSIFSDPNKQKDKSAVLSTTISQR